MYRNTKHHNRIWLIAALTVLLVLSVIGVVGAVAPALGLEEAPWCETEEHIHTGDCYLNELLVCGKLAHTHSVNCYPVQLADNDINALLTKIDNTSDKRLRSVVSTTVRAADRLAAQEESALTEPVPSEPETGEEIVSPEQIVRINATVARYGYQPSVVLNEELNSPSNSGGLPGDTLLDGPTGDKTTDAPDTGTLAVGDEPNTNDNYINFYLRLDGEVTMIGSTEMTAVSDGWLNSYAVPKNEIAALYQAVVETGLTARNLQVSGAAYYLRYHTNGSTTQFRNAASASGNNIVFSSSWGSSVDAHYAILTYSRNSTDPVEFYTLTMDRSAAGEASQIKYVEGGSHTYLLPEPGDGHHWEDASGKTIAAVSLTAPTTVYLKVDSCTVRYLLDGVIYAEDTDILPGTAYTVAEPPEGYRCWRSQDGLFYYGGEEISLDSDLQLTALRDVTVRFVYLDGQISERRILQGNAVTLPAGYWRDDAGTAFAGGESVSVETDTTFTEVSAPPLTVHYEANWSVPSQMKAPATAPSVVGAKSVEVAFGTTVSISRVSSRVVTTMFAGFNSSKIRYGSAYFIGWQTENGEILQPDTSVSYAELGSYDADGDGEITLTGVWDYNSLQSVNFFVKLNSAYSDGELSADYYTPSIFGTYLGGVPAGSDANSLNRDYGIQMDDSKTYLENDKAIRALYGNASGVWLAQIPPDQLVFERLKDYVQGGGALSVQNDAGEFETVNVNDLNENAFAIRWYVFKIVSDNGIQNWHIDGVLIRKEGKVHTTKTFSGNETLIERAKEGFYICAVNESATKRYIMTITEPTEAERQRILDERGLTAAQISAWLTPAETDSGGRNFLWEFGDVDYGEEWSITEYPPDLSELADYAEWVVVDASSSNQSASGIGTSVTVNGITHATDIDNPEWLRVEFNNIYFRANSLMLKKEDAATGRSLAGAQFQFYQAGTLMTFDYDEEAGLYTYDSHGDGAYSTLTCDGYTNISTSGFAYDMGDITVREITAPEGYGLVGDVTIGYVTDTTGDGTAGSDIGLTTDVPFARYDRGLLTIENRAAQNEVTVFKHWNCQDTEREDVIVQLLANGSANDAADILKSSGQPATQTLTAVHGWSHTWTDVPDYANGVRVTWTVREMKIGNELRKADGTFANWIVSYRSVAFAGGTSLIIENTPKRPMLYLEKVDHVTGAALRGAEFKLIAVDADGTPLANAVEKTAVTGASGSLNFDNLRYNQRYRLIESIAPEGYFAYEKPAYFTLAEDGTVTVEAHESVFSAGTAFHIRVTDPAGYILPETGGASASRYYIAGAAMLLAALLPALYLRKKREEACTEH